MRRVKEEVGRKEETREERKNGWMRWEREERKGEDEVLEK